MTTDPQKVAYEAMIKLAMLDALSHVDAWIDVISQIHSRSVYICTELINWRKNSLEFTRYSATGSAIMQAYDRLDNYFRTAIKPNRDLRGWLYDECGRSVTHVEVNAVRRRWIAAIIKAIEGNTDVMPDWVTD